MLHVEELAPPSISVQFIFRNSRIKAFFSILVWRLLAICIELFVHCALCLTFFFWRITRTSAPLFRCSLTCPYYSGTVFFCKVYVVPVPYSPNMLLSKCEIVAIVFNILSLHLSSLYLGLVVFNSDCYLMSDNINNYPRFINQIPSLLAYIHATNYCKELVKDHCSLLHFLFCFIFWGLHTIGNRMR